MTVQTYEMVHSPAEASGNRDAMIENHVPQVKYMAERLAAKLPPWVELDDLIGAGMLGLLDAVDKYDAARGVLFKTYAELRIRGAIIDGLRNLDWAPRSMRRRAREVEAAYAEVEAQGDSSDEQVAAKLRISLPEFHQLLNDLRTLKITSLEIDEEDDSHRAPRLDPVSPQATPAVAYEITELRERLALGIDWLPPKQREVIALYYVEELTMKEIGQTLGVTESRVSQIHTQAVVGLRHALKTLQPTPAFA